MSDETKVLISKKYRGCNVAIWETKKEDALYHTVSMNAYYKDKDGNWKNTNYIKIDEVPKLIMLLQLIYADFIEVRNIERKD